MTQDISDAEKLFDELRQELSLYASESYLFLVNKCYHVLLSCIGAKQTLTEQFMNPSLLAAIDAAKLRIHPKFVASALLYYPLSSGIVSSSQVATIDKDVSIATSNMIVAGRPFDQFLPWNRVNYLAELNAKLATSKTEHRKQQEQDDIKVRYIMATSELPEIAIVSILQRLQVVRSLNQLVTQIDLQNVIAREALNIHAVVAEMLGIWSIKWRIEDAAFKILHPELYREIARDLNERRVERDAIVNHAITLLQNALNIEGLPARVTGRAKHIYGLYLKMKQTGLSAKEVNDNLGLRIIVDDKMDETDCYLALDILLRLWKPVEEIYGDTYFRDWIVHPKPNGYQSIHTTVHFREENNRPLEVQIRTEEMHETAEYGVASHWVYKRTGNSTRAQARYQQYVDQMATFRKSFEERQKKVSNPSS